MFQMGLANMASDVLAYNPFATPFPTAEDLSRTLDAFDTVSNPEVCGDRFTRNPNTTFL